MKKFQIITILLSVLVGLSIITIAYIKSNDTNTDVAKQEVVLSSEELAKNDGIEGNSCYVAIEGVVYEINQGNKWKDGEHIPSEGLAYCGRDLTEVIEKSPHGESILSILTEIGKLE